MINQTLLLEFNYSEKCPSSNTLSHNEIVTSCEF